MQPEDGVFGGSIWEMIAASGPVVQGVLVILVLMSIASWAITIAKYLQLKKANLESREFSEIFWETKDLSRIDDSSDRLRASPLVTVFRSGNREFGRLLAERDIVDDTDFRAVERSMQRAEFDEGNRLEKGLTFLASTASAAPFIGLFGTVWGIMNAFHGLSDSRMTTLQAVAPGISEALIATAIGLAAAIPAAIAYNYFSVSVRRFRQSMDRFSREFIALARQTLRHG